MVLRVGEALGLCSACGASGEGILSGAPCGGVRRGLRGSREVCVVVDV